MQPNTQIVKNAIMGCIALLFIMMFDLPYGVYIFLNSLISFGLLSFSAYFLRPATCFLYDKATDAYEYVQCNYNTGTISGFFSRTKSFALNAKYFITPEVPLTEDNSEIINSIAKPDGKGGYIMVSRAPIPPICEPMAIILMLLAITFSPLSGLKMPKDYWIMLDLFTISILISAIVIADRDNKGGRIAKKVFSDWLGKPQLPDRSPVFFLSGNPMMLFAGVVFMVVLGLYGLDSRSQFMNDLDEFDGLVDILFIQIVSGVILFSLICFYVQFVSTLGLRETDCGLITVPYFLSLFFILAITLAHPGGMFNSIYNPPPKPHRSLDW